MTKRTLSHKECATFRKLGLLSVHEQCWEIDVGIFLARNRRTGQQRFFKKEIQQ